jgi:hypothetical protein
MARVRQRRNLGTDAEKTREGRESGQLLNNIIMSLSKGLIQETRSQPSCKGCVSNCSTEANRGRADQPFRIEHEPESRRAWQVKVWQL